MLAHLNIVHPVAADSFLKALDFKEVDGGNGEKAEAADAVGLDEELLRENVAEFRDERGGEEHVNIAEDQE